MPIVSQSSKDFKRWLEDKLSHQRIPIAGTIELVAQCNFHCTHCYMGNLREDFSSMDTALVLSILHQLADEGCISLGFTGGEPLLRKDYRTIHEVAHQLGFWISLLTNGALIDTALVHFLAAYPPRAVEISLYGGDESSYFEVTGKKGQFEKVVANIDQLLDAGIHVVLKSVLLRPILASIDKLFALAEARNIDIVFDPSVTPSLNQDMLPTRLRVAPKCAVGIEIDSVSKKKKLSEYHHRIQESNRSASDSICGAGYNGFHVDYTGHLLRCIMLREPGFSLKKYSFAQAWEEIGRIPRPTFPPETRCAHCEIRHLCSYCPGALACGDPPPKDENSFYCQVAQARANLLR